LRKNMYYLIGRHLFEALAVLLLGCVIFAILLPEIVSAREAARRAVCTNTLLQYSGSHGSTVCLERGRIAWVSNCRVCGSHPCVRIFFVEKKSGGEFVSTEQTDREGVAVLVEAIDRLRRDRRPRGETGNGSRFSEFPSL
jgi:hypothetical protein